MMKRRSGWASLLFCAGLAGCSWITAEAPCESHGACQARGPAFADSVCAPSGQCVSVRSPDCPQLLGGPLRGDTVLLAKLAALTGPNAEEGRTRAQAAEMALSELREHAVGIPGAPGQAPSPVAIVVCDQVADLERTMAHLLGELQVQAVVGPGFSGTTLLVARNHTVPAGVLMVNPSATTPDLTRLQDHGLVWRTSMSNEAEPRGIALLVRQIEEALRRGGQLATTDPMRVAILAKADAYGKGLSDGLQSGGFFELNGKLLSQQDARAVLLPLTFAPSAPAAERQDKVKEVLRFGPQVILTFGTAEMAEVVEEIELGLAGGRVAPWHVMSEGIRLKALRALSARRPDLGPRIRLFSPQVNPRLYTGFAGRWRARFGGDLPDVYGTTGTYDAFSLLFYSLTAIGGTPSGPALAEGLKRMSRGTRVEAGPGGLATGFAVLAQGGTVDYDGVSGALDFDPATGEAPNDYEILCLRKQRAGDDLADYVSTGQTFSTARLALEGGSFGTCPP